MQGVVSDGAEALASSRRACESPPRLRRDGSPPEAPRTTRTSSPVETAARSSARASPNGALCWFNTSSSSAASRHATDLGLRGRRGGGDGFVERVHATQEAAELEAAEDLLQRGAVGRRGDELGRVDVERQVAPHRREELRVARLVGVLTDRACCGPARARRRARSPPRATRTARSAGPRSCPRSRGSPGCCPRCPP